MENQLTIGDTLSNAFKIGLSNFISLILCLILWIVTLWIPYLNVGTTIAMASLPVALSKGKVLNPLEIFSGKYRKPMGDFFLLVAMRSLILGIATLFLIIPALVLQIAYILAIPLLIDKGITGVDALNQSNHLTHGHKWTIFFSYLILIIPLLIFISLLPPLGVIYLILIGPILLGMIAYIYKTLGQPTGE
jgi:hypothetical protein